MTKWQRSQRIELRGLATALMGAPDAPAWMLPTWFLGGLIVNKTSEFLNMPALALVALLMVVSYGVWVWWRQHRFELVPELREQEPPGKHGLILPLAPISLLGGTPEEREALPAAINRLHDDNPTPPTDDDFALLERSNLESPLRAIEYHYEKKTLRDCWLITTEDVTYKDGTTERGSSCAAKILERWFFYRNPEAGVSFHYGKEWSVHPRDYARMWLLVDELFERAPYKAENVIVDITPGTKPMTLAIALACLEPKRTMQYIAAGRDPLTGEVLVSGRRVPVLIDVDPYLYQQG